jgi:hypothetical protein
MTESSPQLGRPDRNLALELVRTTEAAALAAARLVGMGDKIAADQAAVDAMRIVLETVSMDGVVVIGEGEKDEAPMLYNGEQIGDGSSPSVDIAVDPLEGTTLTAKGMPSALSVIAMSPKGTMFDPGQCVYMTKLAGGAHIADLLDLDRPLPETLRLVAQRKSVDIRDLVVIVLDRPRHEAQIAEIREAGARVRLIADGDVSAALTRRPAVGDRRYTGGRHQRRRAEVHGRRAGHPAVPARRDRARGRAGRRLRPGCTVDAGRPRQEQRLLLQRHRRDRRRHAARRPLPGPVGDDGVPGHALALGHRAAHHGDPQPRQAARVQRGAIRLNAESFACGSELNPSPAARIQ